MERSKRLGNTVPTGRSTFSLNALDRRDGTLPRGASLHYAMHEARQLASCKFKRPRVCLTTLNSETVARRGAYRRPNSPSQLLRQSLSISIA